MTEPRMPWQPPWIRARKRGWPVGLAVVGAFVQVIGSMGAAHQQPHRVPLDALGYALLLAGPAMLPFRHRWPGPVVAGVAAVTAGYLVAGYPYGPVFLSLVVAFCSAVQRGHRRAAWVSLGALYAVHVVITFALPTSWLRGTAGRGVWWQEVVATAWVLLLVAVAELLRFRREQLAARRAAEEEAARRAADEERLRMARELHDILAHSISLINVQAGVALELIDSQPEQVRSALTTIKATSKDALGEVRRVLGTLRMPGDSAPRSPAPGLARLDELITQARHAGLTVAVRTTGPARQLPAAVDLAGFRIVQESLTNVIRHSAARTAEVRLDWADGLTVTVTDPGPAGAGDAGGSGSGLIGMRERVTALGGTLEAGPEAGGFRVRAWLPIDGRGGEA